MDDRSKTSQDHLIGYCTQWSARPGDNIQIMVSTSHDYYEVDVVRLDMPGSTPPSEARVDISPFPIRLPGHSQHTNVGSYVRVDGVGPYLEELDSLTVALWILPTRLPHDLSQVLVSVPAGDTAMGWSLVLLPTGQLCFRASGGRFNVTATTSVCVTSNRWHEVVAGYSSSSGTVLCGFRGHRDRDFICAQELFDVTGVRCTGGRLFMGAAPAVRPSSTAQHFNGRMEDVVIRRVDPQRYIDAVAPVGAVVAYWDFGIAVGSNAVIDRGPHGLNGTAVNMPARAMPGHRWTGRYLDFRLVPDQYGAIHLHEDDMSDAGWTPSFDIALPPRVQSGVYAARLRAGRRIDHVPFVVCPARESADSDIAVVLPTLTYQAYANDGANARAGPASVEFTTLIRQHPEWGRSLYDKHTDGSGFIYSSRARPVVNMRPDYIHWGTGGPRHLSADLHLLTWLAARDLSCDVITDDVVDAEGIDVLEPYAVTITGSHPEYCTEGMLDSLEKYLDRGGSLMYLGGNGYYWVTSIHREEPHVIEVRRGNCGNRSWESEPGSIHHSTTGEPGGLWRHRGRPPNKLVGVGFSASGWDEQAGHYERSEYSLRPEYAWIFDGVDEHERIGDFGASMGGAAGDELDKYSVKNQSPVDAVVLASSLGHSDRYVVAIDELLEITPEVTGKTSREVRADIVYHERPGGGSVFSVGSMCWIASLLFNNGCNNVSTITENVLRRFLTGGYVG